MFDQPSSHQKIRGTSKPDYSKAEGHATLTDVDNSRINMLMDDHEHDYDITEYGGANK